MDGLMVIDSLDSLWFFSNILLSSKPTNISVNPYAEAGAETTPKHTAATSSSTIQNPENVMLPPETAETSYPIEKLPCLKTVAESKSMVPMTNRVGDGEKQEEKRRRKVKRSNKFGRGNRTTCLERKVGGRGISRREFGFEPAGYDEEDDDAAALVVDNLRTIALSRNDRVMKRRLKTWAAAVASSVSHNVPLVAACC